MQWLLDGSGEFLGQVLSLAADMAPYLFLGFLVAGLLHVFVPQQWVYRQLGPATPGSVLKAALLGAPLPLCSCGVIPVAASLKRSGASKPAILSFLISTPVTGVDSMLATYAMMGSFMAIVRPLAGTAVALLAGFLMLAVPGGDARNSAPEAPLPHQPSAVPALPARLLSAVRFGFVELLSGISRALLVGLGLGAAIAVFVPQSLLADVADNRLLSYLLMIAIGTPLYVCATGSIPIAAALMLKGLSPGAALAFLLAGPATNTVTIAVTRDLVGRRGLVVYLLAIVLGSLGLAVLTDLATDWLALPAALSAQHHHDHTQSGQAAWHAWSGYLLLGVCAWYAGRDLLSRMARSVRARLAPAQQRPVLSFAVPSATCSSCAQKIRTALAGLQGVRTVQVDLAQKVVTVETDGTVPAERLAVSLREAGYDAVEQP
jgi:uncharacterized membrane protein YraQ (UPF0718 family)/copper chaperone CopZ